MSPQSLLLIVFVASSAPAVAHSQREPPWLRPAPAHFLWERPPSRLAAERAHEPLGGILGRGDLDYRYTGFFVGAALGVAATIAAFVWCGDTDNACDRGRVLPLGVVMSGVLGLGGAVIGGFLPKTNPPKSPSTP